jgi:hypothetical protein
MAGVASTHTDYPSKLCVTGVRLNEHNYHQWAPTFEIFVVSQRREQHLIDPPPDAKAAEYAEWRASDALVVSWLLNSVDDSIHRSYALVRPASKIWTSLKTTYGNEHNIGRVCDLWEQLFRAEQGEDSPHAFFNRLKSLGDELEVLRPPTTDIASQVKYREEILVARFLAGLHPELANQIRGQILAADTLPTLQQTFNKALWVHSAMGRGHGAHSYEETALAVTRGNSHSRNSDRGRGFGRGGSRQPRVSCIHCGRQNHISEKCWAKFGRPPTLPSATAHLATSTPSSSTATQAPQEGIRVSQADYDELMIYRAQRATDAMANHVISGPGKSVPPIHSPNDVWIIDSGASSHIAGDSSLLSRLSALPTLSSVTLADGRSCTVTGEGTTTLTPDITLDRVLLVPEFPVNLLSISKITKQLFCAVTFFPFHCVFQDLQTGRKIGTGHERGNDIYVLTRETVPPGLAAACTSVSSGSFLLWHKRLGHPSPRKLRTALPWIPVSHFQCESCILGKHARRSFPSRELASAPKMFDVVHCDIWGPSRVVSISGHRYYITFVDDFSRLSWLYLLKDRQSVLSVVTKFINEIQTQHGVTPKIFRTDNALEFVQAPLASFCAERRTQTSSYY